MQNSLALIAVVPIGATIAYSTAPSRSPTTSKPITAK